MSVVDELRQFEKELEGAIKSSFERSFDEFEEFEISPDCETHERINKVVKGLDLEVYGMSIAPSEFTITFNFSGSFRNIKAKARPRYCRISLQNDGNYYLTLTKEYLSQCWQLGITDLEFNSKMVPQDVLKDCITQLKHNLFLRILSN